MFWSVIIPARNEEKALPDCIDSVKKQVETRHCLVSDFEIIIVDNGSVDKTREIAEKRGAKIINEPRNGVGQARKTGAEAATGEFIVNLDADSRLPKDYFLRAAKIFEQEPDLICLGGQIVFYDGSWWLNILRFLFHRPMYYYARLVSGGRVGPLGNNMVFRKSDYQKTAGFDASLRFGEDSDICRKLSKLGKVKIDFVLKCLASSRRYRWNQKPITQFRNFLAVCRGRPIENDLPELTK
ncbi:MAG: glycosyltransferase family 2 protein [Patescibacteria group bacterium]